MMSKMLDGTYTAIFNEDRSDYQTIRLKTVKKGGLAGRQIVEYMSGPDNERSFTGFAFLNGLNLYVWSRMGNESSLPRWKRAVEAVIGDPYRCGLDYALVSKNCFRCGRALTVPISVGRGIGPECIKYESSRLVEAVSA